MTAMPPLRSILNDTPANAIDVDWNFQTIEDYVATQVIRKDGSVAMEAPLNLLGAPASLPTHAVSKGYVDANVTPVGTIWMFAGDSTKVPVGWALCNGVQKTTTDPQYAALFAVIQYAYGGSGGNFNLPNLQGRFPVGLDVPAAPINNNLGAVGGSRDATLVAHSHDIAHGHGHSIGVTIGNHDVNHTHHINHGHIGDTDAQGDHAHTFPLRQTSNVGADVAQQASATGAVGNMATNNAGLHGHNLRVTDFAGDSSTMVNNNIHSHSPSVSGGVTAAPAGTRSDTQGGAGANAHVPPYLTINFIIRIG